MEQPYVDLFDLIPIFEDIELRGGSTLLQEFRDVLDDAILARYDVNSEADVVARYSNDPTSLLWRNGVIDYPVGVFYFNLIERVFVGEEMSASVMIFIVIDYPNRKVIDLSSGIISTN